MTRTIIEVNHLTKRFSDETLAVDDISFSVDEGSIFAFLGPNGAGKSTTIQMLTTILKPTAGTIRLNGIDVAADPSAVRKSFGVVFQDPSLDDELTAFENLEFHGMLYNIPSIERHKRIDTLLSFVDLSHRRNHFVKNFSGGMKRQLEIARGLLHHPRVLFLDEPTAGLDPQTRNQVWHYLGEMSRNEGVTIFFTTHYLEEAQRAAKDIVIIDHGKIIASGTVDSLKKETNTQTLEDAFLSLTGKDIRDEDGNATDRLRMMRRAYSNHR